MRIIKIILLFIVTLILASYILDKLIHKPTSTKSTKQLQTLSPTATSAVPQSQFDLKWKNNTFRISWFSVINPRTIALIPNFSEKLTSFDVREANQCLYLANGGFYSKENLPIGLFSIPGTVLTPASKNSLLNGFFSVTNNGKAVIGSEVPPEDSILRLQSGPLIRVNGTIMNLNLATDEEARRIFVATTTTGNGFVGNVVFGAIYDPKEKFKGPFLTDLPYLIEEFQKYTDISLPDALNLDGGSASTFANPDIFLQELTSVGSFFCVK